MGVAVQEIPVLTKQQMFEIKDYVIRNLPRVLEQDPQFVLYIEGIISERFPRRDEFARLLDEFTSFRQEQHERFERVDQRFEQIDQRFEQVDRRFEQVDRRFEQVDQRFEQVDQRFEQVDQRFDVVEQRIETVRLDLTQQMGDLRQDLTQQMRDLRDWVELIAGRLQVRVGHSLEDVVAGAFRLGLERADILPQSVRLRQKISDPTGLVFKPGKQKEVDLIAQNGELFVFEVKSAPDEDDVDEFADKVTLVRLQNPDKTVVGVFVAVGAEDMVRAACAERGLRLIPDKRML